MSKLFNYVYQISSNDTFKKYIGVRSSDINPENDLGVIYFSSSSDKEFIKSQKINPENFKYEILSVHNDRISAVNEEIRLHKLYGVSSNDNYINKSESRSFGYYCNALNNKVCVIINNKHKLIDVETYRNNKRLYVHINSNKYCVYDKALKTFQINKNNINYINGDFQTINKNKITVFDSRDINKSCFQVEKDHPLYVNGTYKHNSTGTVIVKNISGDKTRISIQDQRYLSNEYVHISKDMVTVKDIITGETFSVSKYDENYINKKYVSVNKGMTTMIDSNGKIYRLAVGDPLISKLNLISIFKNHPKSKEHRSNLSKSVSNIYIVNDVEYIGRKEIANIYNVSMSTVMNRCKSNDPKWSNWTYKLKSEK